MESINVFKGYGKVNPNLEATHQPRSKQKLPTLPSSAILLLTLLIALVLAALIHKSVAEPPEAAKSIQTVCSVTHHPTSCFTTISSLNFSKEPDPQTIFHASLQVSIKELTNLSSLFTALNHANSQAAMNDCLTQFDDALSRLNESLLALEALTEEKVNDIQTWIGVAMTDQETCKEGLEETGSRVPDEVKVKMERSNELLSNSLAIIANMHTLLQKMH